jgi:sodium pump decarboxylase gamma subunit
METVLYGLQVAVIGMLVVFVGLYILILFIGLIRQALKRNAAPEKAADPGLRSASVTPPPAVREQGANGALLAVITAAVAAALGAEGGGSAGGPAGGFVVRAVRRVQKAPAWNRAGREEQMYNRM